MLCVLFLGTCGTLWAQTPNQVSLLGPSQVRLGSGTQYRALVNGAITSGVLWSVDGVVGGSSSTGPISASGLYSPSAAVWAGHSVTISATTELAPTSSASMTVKILNPLPNLTSGSVTQTAPGVNFLLDVHGAGFVSASRLLVSGVEVTTIFVSPTELRSTIVVPQGTASVNAGVVNPHAEQRAPVSLTLPVQTASVATLAISPASVAFGNLALNTPSTEPVTLTSTGTAPVTVSSGQLSGTGFTMSGATFPITLNPGLALKVDVQFNPATAGPATGQLSITSNSSVNPTAVIPLSGSGGSGIVVSTNPAAASLTAGSTQQFAASVSGASNTAVVWTVSGIGCTGAACGTISASGLYTAPEVAPVPATATVTATSEADDTKSATSAVTIEKNSNGATYYLATAADGGNDSNSGLSSSLPWLSPNHSLNCGDTIIAAPGAYSSSNFYAGKWGKVNCPAGNNVAWVQCATFDTCKISVTSGTSEAVWIDSNYWGISGFEASVSAGVTYGACFVVGPNGSTVHHVIFANNVANGCAQGGFISFNQGTSASADYIVIVGNIAYNAAQGNHSCTSGISIYQPMASDTNPGTHIFIAGNFSYGNVDASPCNGTPSTDGEAVILDTFDFSQGGGTPYTQQAVVENNVGFFNGGRGFEIYNNRAGSNHATVYFIHNTAFGNMTDPNQTNGCLGRGDLDIGYAFDTTMDHNLAQTRTGSSCNNGALFGFVLETGNTSDVATNNWVSGAGGDSTLMDNASGFTLGAGNVVGTNPNFANPVNPGAPNCSGAANVPGCMAPVIADYTPTVSAAEAYGYQAPSTTSAYDPLYPQWLCTVNLPSGLVTAGCQAQP